MKIELIDEETFVVYLTDFTDLALLAEEEEIRNFLKGLILRLKKILDHNFHGYYQLSAYVSSQVMILEFYQIDEYTESVDLNMILYLNSTIYFKFADDSLILGKKLYHQGFYYVSMEKITDLMRLIEFGTFIYGEEAERIEKVGKWITFLE